MQSNITRVRKPGPGPSEAVLLLLQIPGSALRYIETQQENKQVVWFFTNEQNRTTMETRRLNLLYTGWDLIKYTYVHFMVLTPCTP